MLQSRNVDTQKPIRPLPPLAQQMAHRLEELLGVAFDQLTVNEYEPGVGLSAHVDTHSAFTGKSDITLAGKHSTDEPQCRLCNTTLPNEKSLTLLHTPQNDGVCLLPGLTSLTYLKKVSQRCRKAAVLTLVTFLEEPVEEGKKFTTRHTKLHSSSTILKGSAHREPGRYPSWRAGGPPPGGTTRC